MWRAPSVRLQLVGAAPQAQDGEHERREEDLRGDDDQGRGKDGEPRLAQRAEAAARPFADDDAEERDARDGHDAREQEPVLESKPSRAGGWKSWS